MITDPRREFRHVTIMSFSDLFDAAGHLLETVEQQQQAAEAQDVIEWLASDTSDLPLEQQIALAYGDCNLEARRNEILEHYKEATPEEQEALREELAESEQVE